MAEWWLLDERTQDSIADYIDSASGRVIDNFDAHGNENSLTAALGQELRGRTIVSGDTKVTFDYRNFLEQHEEPLTGADGGFLVTIENSTEVVKKGVFFQAKRFPQNWPTRSLNLTRKDAKRLKGQIQEMLVFTEHCILLGQTQKAFYAVDAGALTGESIERLRLPFDRARLITLGTYLGKWVARCTRGDLDEVFIQGISKPQGFLKHLVTMNVETKQPPLLTNGIQPIDLNSLPRDKVPKPRWRG